MNLRHTSILSTCLSAVLAATLLGAASPASAAETTTIRPATLERGENPGVPQILGTTILHRGTSITLDVDEAQLLGRSGGDYVVVTYGDAGGLVERVTAGGERTTLVDSVDGEMMLSRDGALLLEAIPLDEERTRVVVRDAADGDRLGRRTFRGAVRVLDADGRRAVLGGTSPDRTFWWHTRTDGTRRVAPDAGYFADIRADRVGVLTDDPYDGGCSVVSSLTAPGTALWESCRHAVLESSPTGRRLVTVPILMDGPLSQVTVHRDHGRLLARYRAPGGLGRIVWEGPRSLLLVAHGDTRSAVVRCVADACERASRLVDAP